jgi:hypothetical protein
MYFGRSVSVPSSSEYEALCVGLAAVRRLCHSTPFTTNNAVMLRKTPYLRVDRLFGTPEMLPFEPCRRLILDVMGLDPLFAVARDDGPDGFEGVRLRVR